MDNNKISLYSAKKYKEIEKAVLYKDSIKDTYVILGKKFSYY
ncbi:hypothetical protein [Legionella donaldsonii]|nr:hypothetical protein [Legionella donaldsonii]